VLVTRASEADELRALIAELVAREDTNIDFARATRFDPEELFSAREAAGNVLAFVQIDDDDAHLARLYFSGPRGERFLVRRVALSNGLDAVGRELIAQAVASSVSALLRSPDGLNREQASAEVARETAAARQSSSSPQPLADPPAPPASPSPPSPSPSDRTNPPSATTEAAKNRAFHVFAGIRYLIQIAGPALTLGHGPGLELGVGTSSPRLLRVRLVVDRSFPQELQVSELSATVQNTALRAILDASLPLTPRQFALIALGGGIDLTRIDPGAAQTASVTPATARTHATAALRTELRYEFREPRWYFAIAACADIVLSRTHYDLQVNGNAERVATPWQLRPGANTALGLIW